MNLIQYEIFASVAQTQNISKTAQDFYITQPAASHQLNMLEENLGVKLLDRTNRGAFLTEAGEEFLPYVQELLTVNARGEARMRSIADGMSSKTTVAMLSSSTKLVNECLIEFGKEYPGIQVDISLIDGEDMVKALHADSYDFFFALSKMTNVDCIGYEEMIIKTGNLALFVNKELAEKMNGTIDWDMIAVQPFMAVPKTDVSLSGKITRVCMHHGFTPHVVNIFNRAEMLVLAVNAGLGVAMLPETIGDVYKWPNVVCIPMDEPDAISQISCIWNPKKVTPAGEKFLGVVKKLYS